VRGVRSGLTIAGQYEGQNRKPPYQRAPHPSPRKENAGPPQQAGSGSNQTVAVLNLSLWPSLVVSVPRSQGKKAWDEVVPWKRWEAATKDNCSDSFACLFHISLPGPND
jgi:hypothetical protein